MTKGSEIDYHALQQDAMRSVVRSVLIKIAADGLPGEHHFYISFLTQGPGVILSKRLKQKYPHDMTIVLQHRFWDLIVSDDRFEVKLTFDGIPERLVVPYRAIKMFIDPSVGFGLQFEEPENESDMAPVPELTMDAAFDQVGAAHADVPRAPLPKKTRARRARADKDAAAKDAATAASKNAAEENPPFPEPASAAAPRSDAGGDKKAETPTAIEGGAQIFSLDQFRKK